MRTGPSAGRQQGRPAPRGTQVFSDFCAQLPGSPLAGGGRGEGRAGGLSVPRARCGPARRRRPTRPAGLCRKMSYDRNEEARTRCFSRSPVQSPARRSKITNAAPRAASGPQGPPHVLPGSAWTLPGSCLGPPAGRSVRVSGPGRRSGKRGIRGVLYQSSEGPAPVPPARAVPTLSRPPPSPTGVCLVGNEIKPSS